MLHIDAGITVKLGSDAASLLVAQNDAAAIDGGGGIERVDRERWEVAQKCERQHWFGSEALTADDHNYANYLDFGGYRAIQGMTFGKAIELGCGPFTNLRYIARQCNIGSVDLLDPLLRDYLSHRNRYYDTDVLYMAPNWSRYQVVHQRIPWLLRGAARRLGMTVPIRSLHNVAIEDFLSEEQFDLVVIVNVIEHCRDLEAIFGAVRQILAPRGVLVFGDIGFDPNELADVGRRQWDAAHPLRPRASALDSFLSSFKPLLDTRRPDTAGLYQRCTFRNFIGVQS